MLKNVAVLLTSKPESGGGHQWLVLLMEALAKCNKKYFNVIGIGNNHFWDKWCREHQITCIRYGLNQYSEKEKHINQKYPYLGMFISILKNDIGKLILKNKIDLLICGQQTVCIPKCLCKIIHPVHDLMHRYERRFPEVGEAYDERELIFKNVARISDVVFVDSKLGAKQFRESYYNKKHFPKSTITEFIEIYSNPDT